MCIRVIYVGLLLLTFTGLSCSTCILDSNPNVSIVYNNDQANGITPATSTWVQNFLGWWQLATPSHPCTVTKCVCPTTVCLGMNTAQIKACNLANYPQVRVFIEPGGNAYNQLSGLGITGTTNLINYINRPQSQPSAYVGICAGTYVASHDYLWETMYEGPGYYNFGIDPPLSIFPHTVEGSLTDIVDDQYGSYESNGAILYRFVNVSNTQKMLYYGGATFGYNGSPDYTNINSSQYDSKTLPLIYFSDFYGYETTNLPAVWSYNNLLLTSVHPEADDSICVDCPNAGTIPVSNYQQNWAWFATYINAIAYTNYPVPNVSVGPIFNTVTPHNRYPTLSCYSGSQILFCDDFTTSIGTVYPGISMQWQRNQTTYNTVHPWNVTFTGTLMGQPPNYYGSGQAGISDGWLIVVPKNSVSGPAATVICKPMSTMNVTLPILSYYYKGITRSNGFKVDYTLNNGFTWTQLFISQLNNRLTWTYTSLALPVTPSLQIRFSCIGGVQSSNFCGIDTVRVTYT
jgi:glutamine amidotransferase-like uncharacterized protein